MNTCFKSVLWTELDGSVIVSQHTPGCSMSLYQGSANRCHSSSQPKLQRALKYLSSLCNVTRQSLQHQPKEQVHQRSQFQELHREDVTIQMLSCRTPLLLLPGSMLSIAIAHPMGGVLSSRCWAGQVKELQEEINTWHNKEDKQEVLGGLLFAEQHFGITEAHPIFQLLDFPAYPYQWHFQNTTTDQIKNHYWALWARKPMWCFSVSPVRSKRLRAD